MSKTNNNYVGRSNKLDALHHIYRDRSRNAWRVDPRGRSNNDLPGPRSFKDEDYGGLVASLVEAITYRNKTCDIGMDWNHTVHGISLRNEDDYIGFRASLKLQKEGRKSISRSIKRHGFYGALSEVSHFRWTHRDTRFDSFKQMKDHVFRAFAKAYPELEDRYSQKARRDDASQ